MSYLCGQFDTIVQKFFQSDAPASAPVITTPLTDLLAGSFGEGTHDRSTPGSSAIRGNPPNRHRYPSREAANRLHGGCRESFPVGHHNPPSPAMINVTQTATGLSGGGPCKDPPLPVNFDSFGKSADLAAGPMESIPAALPSLSSLLPGEDARVSPEKASEEDFLLPPLLAYFRSPLALYSGARTNQLQRDHAAGGVRVVALPASCGPLVAQYLPLTPRRARKMMNDWVLNVRLC
ncbi:unnamed protein product [Phytomonas sp. EM1]|nr:unnamed protein product [Phytomonas sp. EM1]|eukprot:CCW63915.1 unnamed protein product [Phytomonas sp. isolate EM1]